MRLLFVAGHEYVPESWWRAKVPADMVGEALRIGRASQAVGIEGALQADLGGVSCLWVHMPMGDRSARLIDRATRLGIPTVVDFCEDPWRRDECGGQSVYDPEQLRACDRAIGLATRVVVATAGLLGAFPGASVVEPILPDGWGETAETEQAVCWWSDGRGKHGLERVADGIAPLLVSTETEFVHVQFPHQDPFRGKLPAAQQMVVFASGNPHEDILLMREHASRAVVGFDLWPRGGYGESASLVSVLRYAAVRVPILSNRSLEVPGVASAPDPATFAAGLRRFLEDDSYREEMSACAYAWAQEHTSVDQYLDVLREVGYAACAQAAQVTTA